MGIFNAGKINGGLFADADLFINDVNLGPLTVQEDDADNTLRDAISNVTGINAAVSTSGILTISSVDPFVVAGVFPRGGYDAGMFVVENLEPGIY